MKSFRGYISVILKNETVRSNVFLFLGLLINACYIFFNLLSGIIYGNAWFITVAAYYTIMVSVRYLILGNSRTDGCDLKASIEVIRSIRLCGTLMLILCAPITGMIIYTVIYDRIYEYSAFVFVLLFIYAIFSVVRAAVGIFFGEKRSIPSKAANYVRMSSALLSLFNLQTSVLSETGAGDITVISLNFISGVAVSLSVVGFAVKIISESDKILYEMIKKREFDK